jgi:hypothetical protein
MISSGFMVWAFELIKSSLKALYEPVWGWDDSKKMAQLQAVGHSLGGSAVASCCVLTQKLPLLLSGLISFHCCNN